MFYSAHGRGALKRSTSFCIKFLQFLTLFVRWCYDGVMNPLEQSPEMIAAMRRHRLVNRAFRRNWCMLRLQQCHPEDRNSAPKTVQHEHQGDVLLSDDLLPRFLQLSEELHSALEQPVNDKWMRLASQFMLRAAGERIIYYCENYRGDIIHDNLAAWSTDIEECFAWGYVARARFATSPQAVQVVMNEYGGVYGSDAESLQQIFQDHAEYEDRIWEMFFATTDQQPVPDAGTNGTPPSSGELSAWTSTRADAWDQIKLTLASMSEAQPKDDAKRAASLLLRNQKDFINLMWDFVDGVKRLLYSRQWYGEPILVQLEKGYLDGLSDEDFEGFKERAGLDEATRLFQA